MKGRKTLAMCSMYVLRCQSNACGFQQKIHTLSILFFSFLPKSPPPDHSETSIQNSGEIHTKSLNTCICYIRLGITNLTDLFFFFPYLIQFLFRTFVPGGIVIIWHSQDSYLGGWKTRGIDGHSVLRNPGILYRTSELL